ncbi:MAG: CZB domain-containing protein [SAR324 cluster bacterium]|nr:CZB domain-containing protein [SAR324 cluster bacterium]
MLLDINYARIVHLEWELTLEELLTERKSSVQLTSHKDCMVGVWLYSEGLSNYRHLEELPRLEKLHKDFHTQAQRVIDLHTSYQEKRAEEAFLKLKELSKDIIFLLTLIELKILHRKQTIDKFRHPIRALSNFFSGKSRTSSIIEG